MPFLPPNQQRQSTEGKTANNNVQQFQIPNTFNKFTNGTTAP